METYQLVSYTDQEGTLHTALIQPDDDETVEDFIPGHAVEVTRHGSVEVTAEQDHMLDSAYYSG